MRLPLAGDSSRHVANDASDDGVDAVLIERILEAQHHDGEEYQRQDKALDKLAHQPAPGTALVVRVGRRPRQHAGSDKGNRQQAEEQERAQQDAYRELVERPNARRPDGNLVSTVRQENYYERAVGTNGRSGGQWAIWEALFSPVGPDGYAAPIWDRETGEIDSSVADYWRENWDLTHYLVQNWNEVGDDLTGKLHVTVGDMDTYYLNNAVELMEEAMADLTDPSPAVSFEYGRPFEGFVAETDSEPLTEAIPFSNDLTGLVEGSIYQFRAKAVAGDATVYGETQTLLTYVDPPEVW